MIPRYRYRFIPAKQPLLSLIWFEVPFSNLGNENVSTVLLSRTRKSHILEGFERRRFILSKRSSRKDDRTNLQAAQKLHSTFQKAHSWCKLPLDFIFCFRLEDDSFCPWKVCLMLLIFSFLSSSGSISGTKADNCVRVQRTVGKSPNTCSYCSYCYCFQPVHFLKK